MKRWFVAFLAGMLAGSIADAVVVPDPGDLTAYAHKMGGSMRFEVTGTAAGMVWGTDRYTLDSSLGAAAVHAGVLKAGQKGVVKVTILAGLDSYRGSSRNGVTSSDWGPYEGSYKVEKDDGKESGPMGLPMAPANMSLFAGSMGTQVVFEATGMEHGPVWGTDIYTLDSSLETAAVHAGVLKAGQKGAVKVTILPGRDSYRGSSRNGVSTGDWGPYEGSYKVEKADARGTVPAGMPGAPKP